MKRITFLFVFFVCFAASYGIDPDRVYKLTPDQVGLPNETIKIRTGDGYDIHNWVLYPSKENENDFVLVLAYPDKGNMSYWLYFTASFVQKGYTVVTFDYRGFGKSSDFQVKKDFEYHKEFVTDLVAVVSAVDAKFPEKRLGVWALSMGTIIVTRASSELEKSLDFVIGEGFVTDLGRVIDRIARVKKRQIKLPENERFHQKALQHLAVPMLIFAADNDEITTSEDAWELQRTKPDTCVVVTYEGEHLRGFQVGDEFGKYYISQVKAFLENKFG